MTSRLLAAAGVLLMALGLLVVVRADDGLLRERVVVDDVPVTVLRPPGSEPGPAVVVVHGFSGSSTLMDGIGIAFARDGWVVAMPDLAGHGGNTAGLTDADLAAEVRVVGDWLAAQPDVSEVALLGHSMGAGAVTEAAEQDARPVVALSLPSAAALEPGLDAVFLVGSLEPARFGMATGEAAERGYDTATITGAEHISILFRTQTLQTAVAWLDAAVGRAVGTDVQSDRRMFGVAAAYLGSALLFWPLSGWVLRHRVDRVQGPGSRVPLWVGLPLAAAAAGGLLAVLPALAHIVPLLVGGYLAAFLALTGGLLGVLSRRWERPSAQALVAGATLGGYAAVSVGLPAQLAWAQVSLAGARGVALLGLLVAVVVFTWGEGLLADRAGYGSVVLSRLLLAGVLAGLAVLGAAPGFLLLLLPIVAVVLPWFGAYGVRVTRLSGSPLAAALVQAPPIALLVAITTPIG